MSQAAVKTAAVTVKQISNEPFVHKINIMACGNFFRKSLLKDKTRYDRLFWEHAFAPKEGIPWEVEYVDTRGQEKTQLTQAMKKIRRVGEKKESWFQSLVAEDEIKKTLKSKNLSELDDELPDEKEALGYRTPTQPPTILALHGSPGSHNDFALLIDQFRHKCRVIAPNFPDFKITEKSRYFKHTADQKAEYIRNFLQAIDVKKIDCLIAHSAAVFPASYLWSQQTPKLTINSVALFSTPGPTWVTRSIRAGIARSKFKRLKKVQEALTARK